MFNLDTRVHLNEVWIAFLVHKEFKCTGISVADLLAKLDSAVENNLTCCFRNTESRCIFNNLLMTTLHGAVTIVKVNNVAVIICKHLYFDMLWSTDIFFDENLVVTKSFLGFIAGFTVFLRHVFSIVDDTHTTSAAAVGSFQHNRIANHFSNLHDFFFSL